MSTDEPAGEVEKATVFKDAPADLPPPTHGMFGVEGSGDTTGFGGLVREPWDPPPAQRPYGGYFDDLVDALAAAYPRFDEAVRKIVIDRGELTLYVEREHVRDLAQVLRDDPALRFELLSSVSGVDYLGEVHRLHAVYHLTSMTYRRRVRLEAAMSVEDPHVPSVTPVYPTADWQERETYDMYGIVFDGHPALTRILMPDDWDGFPQRKDYPLGGIPVQYKGATIPPADERRAYR
ncbi:MAG TPA: NADH-quinone oxidoreductase subunit C [Jatrophihabitantaceae bacterium]|jgi:NADH-quinone oxidoreductase subunit C